MTFWAGQSDNGRTVDVNVTYGPIAIKVQEDPGHLRSFWNELGRVLDKVEQQGESA